MVNRVGSNMVMPEIETAVKPASASDAAGKSSGNASGNSAAAAQAAAATPDVLLSLNGEEVAVQEDRQGEAIKGEDVETMTDMLNEVMDSLNLNLSFEYHENLKRLSVKMVDRQTREVIKEFPPEAILKALEKTKEWLGVFLDKDA